MNPEPTNGYKWRVEPFFKWYDFWIGAYYDQKYQTLYICPLPTIGIKIYRWETTEHAVWRVTSEMADEDIRP